ncbi:glycosyltransferase family 2 protein [Pseudobutyrivibrio xylanivorans]|uniref:Glycosyl transferase family 2 n=1 Tax=Pseudobutyrivibrio xylanivorans DSM 14809 TaxID=1123012 RepID=A0A1M6D9P3_PSEXY|nr:glycosyltransferase [Pseudobutyrivibrio xylanivorans]SHI69870.1 Glycosyl transferase family 2 [Pseudobutyrivibrio xylanivorans DSM 14809]
MKLSVIIPIYNSEKHIDRCLQSVARQNLDDMEIICVDDGSTDNSYNILLWYQQHNPKIKVYRQSRKYAGSARNLGLSKASGEYIHFLDSDDYLYDNVYSQIYMQAAENKLDYLKFRCFCFMAGSGIQNEDHLEYSLLNVPEKYFDGRLLNVEEDIDLIVKQFSHTPWSGIYRREFLEKNNILFNELICVNDRSFYATVIANAEKISLSNIAVVNHQIGRETSLVGIRAKNFECHYKSFYIIENAMKNVSEKVRKTIIQSELLDTIYWFNNMPEYLKTKEQDRFNDFIDKLDMKYIDQNEITNLNQNISREKRLELIREDVSGECYYRYSKLTSAGKRIEDILNKEELKEIYVYGVGEIGRMVLSDLSLSGSSRVKGIFDKRAANEKIVVEGYENVGIKTPENIPRDNVPVVITPSRNYTGIIRELVDNGIEQSRIVLFNDLLKIVDEL